MLIKHYHEAPCFGGGHIKKNMMKWKELENDPKKSVLEKKDKKDCKYWEWFGTDGCHIKYWKCCLFCLDYEVKDEQ